MHMYTHTHTHSGYGKTLVNASKAVSEEERVLVFCGTRGGGITTNKILDLLI